MCVWERPPAARTRTSASGGSSLRAQQLSLLPTRTRAALLRTPPHRQERPDAGLRISSANSAWLKSAYTWQAAYEAALVEFYNATLGSLTTAAPINAWVSGATQGKITEIVSDEVVQQATLLLVNAIYFKGQWVDQFDK